MFLVGASFHIFLRDAVGSDWKKVGEAERFEHEQLTVSTGKMAQCLQKHIFIQFSMEYVQAGDDLSRDCTTALRLDYWVVRHSPS